MDHVFLTKVLPPDITQVYGNDIFCYGPRSAEEVGHPYLGLGHRSGSYVVLLVDDAQNQCPMRCAFSQIQKQVSILRLVCPEAL